MLRYVTLNSSSNANPQIVNKKSQKTVPISLLSGGNSFFVKIKSNQIASNYNDTSNKLKPNTLQKINSINYNKDNKSYNKYLNNSQQKNSFIFAVNNSIEINGKNPKKSIVNKSKQDLFNHNKGIYSFTSMKHKDNMNNKTINSSSSRQNYNGVLLTDVELLKKNMNKNFNVCEDKIENTKINKNKNEKNNNNTLKCKYIRKEINSKNKSNNNFVSESSLNRKIKTLTEKNTILTTTNKYSNINNQMKLYKKNNNQFNLKNNKNNIKTKNLTNLLFNNSVIEKSKQKNIYKNNFSEGKNKFVYHGNKKNKLICCKELTNNNTNIFKDHFIDTDEFNSSISKKKIEKRIKSINIKSNNETLKIQKINNNSKSNFNPINNNKSLVVHKKNCEKIKTQHTTNKSNVINNPKSKLLNSLASGEIFKLNYTLTELLSQKPNTFKSRMNKPIYNNDNKQRDFKIGNNYLLSDLTSYNINKNTYNNFPNIIINNNYLYNYMPFVTLNNSVNDDNINRLSLNRNSFIDNKLESNNSMGLNNISNCPKFKIDKGQTYILNYSSFADNNKNLNNNNINKENNKSKINKKYKNEQQIKINKIENNIKNNYINKKNNYINNFNPKYINSNTLDNINKTNSHEINIFPNRVKTNYITERYISKEKSKKPKQNPPLSKNPKKLNILSLIQENNRKIKDSNGCRPHQLRSFVETDNFNKCYQNKNVYETIDYILYPENYKIKDSIDVLDNFDDMNTIIKKINFENVDLKSANIFTVNDNKKGNNFLYTKFCDSFNKIFDKKFLNRNHMSATQNKTKNNNLYHSRQSGSTKDSNKENSSIKKYRVFSYLENKFEKK